MRAGLPAALPALALAVALAGCGEPARAPEPEPTTTPAAAAPAWRMEASAAGAAIVYSEGGAERLRIACRPGPPADLWVQAPGLRQVGSEERLTLGAGDELAVLVVSQETPPGAPMTAAGQLTGAWVEALGEGRPVGASYGASCLSLPAPPPEVRTPFAQACRAALP